MASQEKRVSITTDEPLLTPSTTVPQDSEGGSTNTTGGIRLAGVLAGMGSGIHSPTFLYLLYIIFILITFRIASWQA